MSGADNENVQLPPEQQAIRDKCFHPSGTFAEFPIEDIETSIPARFEKIACVYPDRLAVKMGDRSFTYDELNVRANRIAHRILQARGSGSEPVALLFEHGNDAIAGILGVLKAGRISVSLDPTFPAERNSFVLRDAESALIVTNSRNVEYAARLLGSAGAVLNIDEIDEAVAGENLCLSAASDVAILNYTSGSTGEPKGVIETHESVLRSVKLHADEMRTSIADKLTLLHSVSFASAYVNLFQALLNGASLAIFDVKAESIHRFAQWLSAEQITIYHSSPALFRELGGAISPAQRFPDLRLIHLSGAPITLRDFQIYKRNFWPGALLELGMGSTEARAICSAFVDGNFSFPEEGAPIGYPRPGKKILLVDESGGEVAPGETGEIVVRGHNLNQGYWRRPELTEAKFSSDPSGERIYLTGDLGRMLPDGFLLHLGRKDSLVKVRGYRVEVGEIERVLLEHRQIKNAAVVAWDYESGDRYLIAYLVARDCVRPPLSELFDLLQSKLPHYMMPAGFVFLKDLPLTNGKLDRKMLPAPDRSRPESGIAYMPPRTETEEKLIRIWEKLLDVSPIGVHDNFFHLGGHSLLASRFVSELYQAFYLELPLRSVFELPTVAKLAEWVETLGSEALDVRKPPMVAVSRRTELPLSFSQEGLWFLNQLNPTSCAYNLSCLFQLQGRIDVTALERSFNEIVRRHEALRTVFKSADGKPLQVILASMAVKVSLVDLRNLVGTEQEMEIVRLRNQELLRPFDLTQGPLFRVTLMQLKADAFVLSVIFHHIVFDGWSTAIFARELSLLYDSFAKGRPCSLPDLHVQYADFAVWQRERFQSEWKDAQIAYWKRKLKQLPPLLQLPIDKPRPPVQSFRGAIYSFALPETLTTELKRLGQQHSTTLFMTLLAAFEILLQRYTGQNDIVLGSPVAGRNHREVEPLIGFFANMVVLRTDLSGDPTVRELLARVREVCLEAYTNQDLPFEKLVEELKPERSLGRSPLVQATFTLQNSPRVSLTFEGRAARELDFAGVLARFDLHLFLVEEKSRVRGSINYDTDLFNAPSIARMADHFQVLLEAMNADPDARISTLPILTPAESHQLLVEWNDTAREYPDRRCIHERFEDQVERTPDAVAVVYEDQKLTYRELNERSNQLARYLREHGVGAGVLVGICVARSLDMIIGLLGILKAGGAYVPLDPSYPPERLRFMLHDAHAAVLLTQERFLVSLTEADPVIQNPKPEIENPTIVVLDRDWPEIARECREGLHSEVSSGDLAYVIYTSGSTGKPKGVEIRHGELLNYVNFCLEHYPVRAGRGSLVHSSIAFDATVTGLYTPLLVGRAVYLLDEAADCEALGAKLRELRDFSLVKITPAHLAVLNMQISPDEAEGLTRAFIIGGDELRAEQITFWQSHAPGTRLFNEYGPTEATVGSVVYEAGLWRGRGSVPIGRPIDNTQIYILDAQHHPVPVGVAGEIYIGGVGVACGYLNRPETTAERFIYQTFDGEPAERLYRTGDMGRYLRDGNIEFLGRVDDQVKIRGYRIELGEIESVLAQHPAVREAVVIVKQDATGDKRLVAYVVPGSDAPAIVRLRDYLKTKLPDYMIPNAFMFLAAIPLTPNGKVDRSALPDSDLDAAALAQTYVVPRNSLEQRVAAIWSEVLGIKQIGVHDNFFHIGGHSLKATQVVARMRVAFQREIPLRHLFEYPTIAELAAALAAVKEQTLDEQALGCVIGEIEAMTEAEAQRSVTSRESTS